MSGNTHYDYNFINKYYREILFERRLLVEQSQIVAQTEYIESNG